MSDTTTEDDLLLEMIEAITLDVLARIGDGPDARYHFFKRFVGLAQETVQRPVSGGSISEFREVICARCYAAVRYTDS
jgi:hypothetical protein